MISKKQTIEIDLKDAELIILQLQHFLDEHIIPNSTNHMDIKMGMVLKGLIGRIDSRLDRAKETNMKSWWRRRPSLNLGGIDNGK